MLGRLELRPQREPLRLTQALDALVLPGLLNLDPTHLCFEMIESAMKRLDETLGFRPGELHREERPRTADESDDDRQRELRGERDHSPLLSSANASCFLCSSVHAGRFGARNV